MFPVSFMLNLGRKQKIPFRMQVCIWFAGSSFSIDSVNLLMHVTVIAVSGDVVVPAAIECDGDRMCVAIIYLFCVFVCLGFGVSWWVFFFFCSLRCSAGLRGAIAFALALQLKTPGAPYLVTSTLFFVIFSTVVGGGLTEPFVRYMKMRGEDWSETAESGYGDVGGGMFFPCES